MINKQLIAGLIMIALSMTSAWAFTSVTAMNNDKNGKNISLEIYPANCKQVEGGCVWECKWGDRKWPGGMYVDSIAWGKTIKMIPGLLPKQRSDDRPVCVMGTHGSYWALTTPYTCASDLHVRVDYLNGSSNAKIQCKCGTDDYRQCAS